MTWSLEVWIYKALEFGWKFDLQNSEWRGRFGILIATNTRRREGNVGYNSSLNPQLHFGHTLSLNIFSSHFAMTVLC